MLNFSELHNKYYGFYDGVSEKNNVISLLKDNAKNKSNNIALQWVDPNYKYDFNNNTVIENIKHQSITFNLFYELIKKTAMGFKKIGIQKGDCVIIFLPMSLQLYQVMSAVMMIGAKAVFLDSWARREQLGISAKIVNPKAMISFEEAFKFCASVPELLEIPIKVVVGPHTNKYSATLDEIIKNEPLEEIEPVSGEQTALITFTTGSSGIPKGADRTHQFLISQHLALNKCIPYLNTDIDVPAFPIFSLNNIACGVQTVIPIIDIGRPSEKDPLMLVSQIKSCKITCATLSPSMITNIAKFCDLNNIKMPNLRRVITGGAPISNDILKLFIKCVPNAEVLVLYGSTEVEPIAHISANEILAYESKIKPQFGGVNVGKIVEGLEYKLIKINKKPIQLTNDDWSPYVLSNNEKIGELIVSGLHVCKSYYNDQNAVLRAKIIESNGKVWHRTGDVGYFDDENNLWLVGRVHNVIMRNNQLLFPVHTEILLKKHPDVKQAAYVGIPDEKLGEKAYALVTLVNNPKDTKENILKTLENILKSENIPYDKLDVIDNIPMDPRHHSKVEYELLREIILKNENENEAKNLNNENDIKNEENFENCSMCSCNLEADENQNTIIKCILKSLAVIFLIYIVYKIFFSKK